MKLIIRGIILGIIFLLGTLYGQTVWEFLNDKIFSQEKILETKLKNTQKNNSTNNLGLLKNNKSQPSTIINHNNNITNNSNTNNHSVQTFEVGSTPAEYTIGVANSPFRELDYELNRIKVRSPKHIEVYWKIHNKTNKTIYLNDLLKRKLSATRLAVVDFQYQRRFHVLYDRFIPRTNCMLSDKIPPLGRINCSAIVGPRYHTTGLKDNRVLVYLPGSKKPVRVFLDILPHNI